MDLAFITHKLNVDPLTPPKKQKLRRLAKSHVEAMKHEVEKLKQVRSIRGGIFSQVAVKYCGGEKEKWEMESVC